MWQCIMFIIFYYSLTNTNKNAFFNQNIRWNDWFICKVNIRGYLCRLMALIGIVDLPDILFYFFSVIIFLCCFFIFKFNVFAVLIPWCPFSSINWVFKLSLIEAKSHKKRCIPKKQYFWTTWVYWIPIMCQSHHTIELHITLYS